MQQFILSVSVSAMQIGLSAMQIGLSAPFSRFHKYVLIQDICSSLSDLPHSAWQSLGASLSLKMDLNEKQQQQQGIYIYIYIWVSLVTQMVKNLPAMQETRVRSLCQADPLEKGMATHSSMLPERIPWTEEPGGLQSMALQRVGHDWATNTFTFSHITFLEHSYGCPRDGTPRGAWRRWCWKGLRIMGTNLTG